MVYRILADLIVGVHLVFVLFVVLGGILVLWHRWMAYVHLPAAVWGVWIEVSGWVCPLTPLEVKYRTLGGEAGYEGGFIDHYLLPLLYPARLTRDHQIWLGILVGALNLAVYGFVVWRVLGSRGNAASPQPGAGLPGDEETRSEGKAV